jgi:hypothetical protein
MPISKGLLKPLGRPSRNGHKYLATGELEELHRDLKWLTKACYLIVECRRRKNRHIAANAVIPINDLQATMQS